MMKESLQVGRRLSALDHRQDQHREFFRGRLPRSRAASAPTSLIISICAVATVLIASGVGSASAQNSAPAQNSASAPATQDPRARCSQLLAYYDRYGSSRGEDSSGTRHIARMGAGIDCDHGRYEMGIKEMEDLLASKKFPVPPPCSEDRRQATELPGSNGGCS